ncbi:MAG: hypothetical protein ACPIOQ_21120 [Promethearchaeia archaeon]
MPVWGSRVRFSLGDDARVLCSKNGRHRGAICLSTQTSGRRDADIRTAGLGAGLGARNPSAQRAIAARLPTRTTDSASSSENGGPDGARYCAGPRGSGPNESFYLSPAACAPGRSPRPPYRREA